MAANVLENLARWNLQIALLAIVAAGLVPLFRINAPVMRHAFWRSVVAACLLLMTGLWCGSWVRSGSGWTADRRQSVARNPGACWPPS